MLETRRMFVLAMAGAAGFLAAEESRLVGQYPPTPPPPPQPAETPNPAEMHSDPPSHCRRETRSHAAKREGIPRRGRAAVPIDKRAARRSPENHDDRSALRPHGQENRGNRK